MSAAINFHTESIMKICNRLVTEPFGKPKAMITFWVAIAMESPRRVLPAAGN